MSRQPDLAALLNEALMAWLQPRADEARLRRFIAGLEPGPRDEVEQGARAARKALTAFLSAPFAGDQDEWLFAAALRAHLGGRFPWLSEMGMNALIEHADDASAWDGVI